MCSLSLSFRHSGIHQVNMGKNISFVGSYMVNNRTKFGAKIFTHFWEIAIFVLGRFILTHPVIHRCQCTLYLQLFTAVLNLIRCKISVLCRDSVGREYRNILRTFICVITSNYSYYYSAVLSLLQKRNIGRVNNLPMLLRSGITTARMQCFHDITHDDDDDDNDLIGVIGRKIYLFINGKKSTV